MKKKIIVISILLLMISFIVICIFGKKNTLVFDIDNVEGNYYINCDKDIIQCSEKRNDNSIELELTAVNKGKTEISIEGDTIGDTGYHEEIVYVHEFGIITIGNFFGRCRGDISLIISITIIMILIIISLIKKYKMSLNQELYSYKNIILLGMIIFVATFTSWNIYGLMTSFLNGYNISIFELVFNLKESGALFLIFILPIAFIVSIMVTILNFNLLRKEGITWRNMLGIFLCGFICFLTILTLIFELTNIIPRIRLLSYFISIFTIFIAYLECILLATIISSVVSGKHIPKFDKDYIIILGCMIRKDGTLTPLLRARVDRAIEFSKMQNEASGKDLTFVTSGGKGSNEIMPEAEAMKNYLITQGISEEKILVEDKSTNTYENMQFSNAIIKSHTETPNIAFSTTNYHVFRAGIICNNLKINAEGIGSKTKSYYWVNAFIREYIATLVSEKKTHFKMLLLLFIISSIIEILLYLSIII